MESGEGAGEGGSREQGWEAAGRTCRQERREQGVRVEGRRAGASPRGAGLGREDQDPTRSPVASPAAGQLAGGACMDHAGGEGGGGGDEKNTGILGTLQLRVWWAKRKIQFSPRFGLNPLAFQGQRANNPPFPRSWRSDEKGLWQCQVSVLPRPGKGLPGLHPPPRDRVSSAQPITGWPATQDATGPDQPHHGKVLLPGSSGSGAFKVL